MKNKKYTEAQIAFTVCQAETRLNWLLAAVFLLSVTLLLPSCSKQENGEDSAPPASIQLPTDFAPGELYFARIPPQQDWKRLRTAPESFEESRKWGPFYELRHADLSGLDLTAYERDLQDSIFDTETRWPKALPEDFDPEKLLALNRNPGLGIRNLHAHGITGKGISVAVIDSPLLLGHDEFAGRIHFYGEVNAWGTAHFHGTLVTSVLAGITCGVAPEAEIYYVGSHNYDVSTSNNLLKPNVSHYAEAIEMLLEVSAQLPWDKRIRVVSISAGWSPKNPGYKAMNKAVRKASEAGIFVVAGNIAMDFKPGLWFWGLDRASMDDPDDPASYHPLFWDDLISQIAGRDNFDEFYVRRLKRAGSPKFLLIPQGSKSVAQAGGPHEYGFYRLGGWSSMLPYISGLYALACQVKADITPEIFWDVALTTGDPLTVERDGRSYVGKRINPVRLIDRLK
jgi:hypothetical protein